MLSASVPATNIKRWKRARTYFVAKPYESKDVLAAIKTSLEKGTSHERLHDLACR